MTRLLAALLMTFVACTALAAEKPNFSGQWEMNASLSDYGQIPAPDSFSRAIEHNESTITVTEEQTGPTATPRSVRKMKTDGQTIVDNINGGEVKLSATWEGNDLIVVTGIDALGLTFKDTMSLSADGKVLTSAVLVQAVQGDFERKIVFDRR